MKTKSKIFIAFILNLIFSIFELFGGIITGSIAIMSDSIHDFGDATSIGMAFFLEKLSDKKPNNNYTYGYARFSVLGALITTLILLISSVIVVYNAVFRIISPIIIDYNGMLIFAIVGLFVNIVSSYFTHGGKSLNQKAVNLHMLEDVLGWVVVLIASIIIKFTNLYIIDPILSIFVALFVVINAIKNLIEITQIFLIKTPKNVDIDDIIKHIIEIDGVTDAHHIHIWSIDGEINLATIHLVVKEYDSKIKEIVKAVLNKHGISHTTIEIETENENCKEETCKIKQIEHHSHCHHHH